MPFLDEQKILNFWKENKIFQKSIEQREGKKDFVFYEGPPTANAPPGLHHVLARSFKDAVCRLKTMQGFRVIRKAGWDTHGLPVEIQVEKELKLKSKKEIEKFGIEEFNQKCKESVFRYIQEWQDLTEKMGYWIDLDHPYITYQKEYIETLWFILAQIYKKGLLYQDFRVSPWCFRCETVLSSHEVAQGYKRVKDPSLYFKVKVKTPAKIQGLKVPENTFFLVWTTTPWTLPGNAALAVNPELEYILAQKEKEQFILAKDLVQVLGNCEILSEFKGRELEGLEYLPPFEIEALRSPQSFKVYLADFVLSEEGTGIVHIAPMYGDEDFELATKVGLPKHHTILKDGTFSQDLPSDFQDFKVKDPQTDQKIVDYLKSKGLLYKLETIDHDYPFCWRCKNPLIYYAISSWFIKMKDLKEKLLENNQKINWIPAHIKEGRFGEWLKEVKDWALTRERFWGTPLPIWECENCKEKIVISSLKELKSQKFSDLEVYLARHGETVYSKDPEKIGKIYPPPDEDTAFLSTEGKEQAKKIAKFFKEKGIKLDLIFCSDLKRAKETAEIVAKELKVKVVEDERLRDLDFGEFHLKDKKVLRDFYAQAQNLFSLRIPGGESLRDVYLRVFSFLKEIVEKHRKAKILIVSHGFPLWIIEEVSRGEEFSGYDAERFSLGEVRKVEIKFLPYNFEGKLDLHRPYIDEVKFLCPKCGSFAKRLAYVIDVWFDSGAMPFAQYHWPFEEGKENLPPKLFPADFIAEGIDQTRGWFYTLLAISTLLDFGPPYLNVICLGHLLDEKGEKMSKSKGNVVDPWEMIQKYGADAVRWYFFTVNQPGESKRFSEKDLRERLQGFVLTFLNCLKFLRAYYPEHFEIKEEKILGANLRIVDKWLLSKLNSLIKKVNLLLEDLDITLACRAIEKFVIEDLSKWWIRRSRKAMEENKDLANLLAYVLRELAKLSAPFAPFISEAIYRDVEKRKESVHLEDWPKLKEELIDQDLEARMDWAREVVSLVLKLRAQNKIKVRQPLAKLEIPLPEFEVEREILDLIKEEVNVKEVILNQEIKEVKLDTTLTPELKLEGDFRELVRRIQSKRKELNLNPKEKVKIKIYYSPELKELFAKYHQELSERVSASKIEFVSLEKVDEDFVSFYISGKEVKIKIER